MPRAPVAPAREQICRAGLRLVFSVWVVALLGVRVKLLHCADSDCLSNV